MGTLHTSIAWIKRNKSTLLTVLLVISVAIHFLPLFSKSPSTIVYRENEKQIKYLKEMQQQIADQQKAGEKEIARLDKVEAAIVKVDKKLDRQLAGIEVLKSENQKRYEKIPNYDLLTKDSLRRLFSK
jgi:septal ring factor EnvC (AmiA/AmiB activator)